MEDKLEFKTLVRNQSKGKKSKVLAAPCETPAKDSDKPDAAATDNNDQKKEKSGDKSLVNAGEKEVMLQACETPKKAESTDQVAVEKAPETN